MFENPTKEVIIVWQHTYHNIPIVATIPPDGAAVNLTVHNMDIIPVRVVIVNVTCLSEDNTIGCLSSFLLITSVLLYILPLLCV